MVNKPNESNGTWSIARRERVRHEGDPNILRVESIERIGTEPVADARGSANSRAAKLRQCPSKGCLLKEFENSIKGNSGGSH